MDCNPPGSSVHGILQARILEWVAIFSSRGSSQPRDQIWVSRIAGRLFTVWATRKAQRWVILHSFYRWGTCGHAITLSDRNTELLKRAKPVCKSISLILRYPLCMFFAAILSCTICSVHFHPSLSALPFLSGWWAYSTLPRLTPKARPERDLWGQHRNCFQQRSWGQESVCECPQSTQDRSQGETNFNWTPVKFQVLCWVFLVGYFI